jgi:hypothetical protein
MTRAERELLRAEAEMRVRAGQSRADVSRELGIPLITLAQWACQDGWRKKDLEAERGAAPVVELGEALLERREAVRAELARLDREIAATYARLGLLELRRVQQLGQQTLAGPSGT